MTSDLVVARIVAGVVRFPGGVLRRPPREARCLAEEAYAEQLGLAAGSGLWDADGLLDFLLDNGLWDADAQALLDGLPKEIEDFKVGLYRSAFKSESRKAVRSALAAARAKLDELRGRRHAHDHLSCEGLAALARARYLLAASAHGDDGRPLFPDPGLADPLVLAAAALARDAATPDDAAVRLAARSDPWRGYWACRAPEGTLFGVPPVDYTDDQVRLVNYALLYDSVHAHPECPPDDVVADDDRLDGWLIAQRRAREKERGDALVDDASGGLARDCGELFLPVESAGDAAAVSARNTPPASAAIRARAAALYKHGRVEEADMPDTRRNIAMELNNMQRT
jgi:hypothetical protein